MRLGRTWGLANWKRPGRLVTLLVGLALMALTFRAYVALTNRVRKKSLFRYWLTIVFPITAMLIPLAVQYVGYRYLTMRSTPLNLLRDGAQQTAESTNDSDGQ